jgi:hypothetical protein
VFVHSEFLKCKNKKSLADGHAGKLPHKLNISGPRRVSPLVFLLSCVDRRTLRTVLCCGGTGLLQCSAKFEYFQLPYSSHSYERMDDTKIMCKLMIQIYVSFQVFTAGVAKVMLLWVLNAVGDKLVPTFRRNVGTDIAHCVRTQKTIFRHRDIFACMLCANFKPLVHAKNVNEALISLCWI